MSRAVSRRRCKKTETTELNYRHPVRPTTGGQAGYGHAVGLCVSLCGSGLSVCHRRRVSGAWGLTLAPHITLSSAGLVDLAVTLLRPL